MNSLKIKKIFFTYKLKSEFSIKNVSTQDINKLTAEFILRQEDKQKEQYSLNCASKKKPLFSNGGELTNINVNFGKNIFTKRELKQYYIDVYLYKEPKYKTLTASFHIPDKQTEY